MKIQILISKKSWANEFKSLIKSKLSKFSKNIKIYDHHNKLKKNFDVNIIFSYFKKIPYSHLKKSKSNLVPHESDLPKGRGMSPLSWQILEGKSKINFSLIEADINIDNGKIYYKKKVNIPKNILFKKIKKIQFNENIKLIIKFLKYYNNNKTFPNSVIYKGKSSYYKKRYPKDSELNINKSIKEQFNLLRIADPENYPSFFYINRKKIILKIKE
tara:strand:- start:364 stop:1008 length:645 start_codon:yes stop_codon:yes gene_type:complete